MKGYLQLKAKYSQYLKSLNAEGMSLTPFLDSHLFLQGYAMTVNNTV